MTHDLALGLLFWIWSLANRGGSPSSPSSPSSPEPSTPPALPAGTRPAPPPWPAVVPEGVPPFPGSAWEYDNPPPPAVQAQARQLLDTLWAKGSGAHKVVQTGGRWIAYQAAIVASGKKGVVAWRLKRAAATPKTRPSSPRAVMVTSPGLPTSSRPAATPARVVIPPKRPSPELAAQQSAASRANATPAPSGMTPGVADRLGERNVTASMLPDLKEGMGMKPQAPNGDVAFAQRRLLFHGYKLEVDGRFGNATRMAVIEFQKRTALAPRIDNQELRKRGFGAVKKATWEQLLSNRPLLTSAPLVRA